MTEATTKAPKSPGVVPYILSPSCDKHIEWLQKVFGARQAEIFRKKDAPDVVMHVSMVVNDGVIFLADNTTGCDGKEVVPHDSEVEETHGFWLHVEVQNPQPIWQAAMANGCTVVVEYKKQYCEVELGCFRDPFGFLWAIGKAGDCRKPGVIPYIFLPDGACSKHIEWMEKALGAKKAHIHHGDNNMVLHCMMEINGGGPLYLSDISGMPGSPDAKKIVAGKAKRFFLHMDVKDPYKQWEVLKGAGAEVTMELKKQFWGDDYGMVKDPFDFEWSVCSINPESSSAAPDGVIPYLQSPSCEKHIDWLKTVFDAEVKSLIHAEDKKSVMHASVKINNGLVYLCDAVSTDLKESPEGPPSGFNGHMNMADPDSVWKRAMANGASQTAELKVQFWGDYYGSFKDPFGFEWAVMKA